GAQPSGQVRAESAEQEPVETNADSDQAVATVTAPGQGDGSQKSIAAAVAGMRAHRGRPEKPRAEIRIDSVSRETYEAATGDLPADELVPVPGASFADIDVSAIHPNARQPRTVFDENDLAELVGSIREIGVLQPIVVRPSRETDGYELIMGERRWRATQAAGLET